MNPGPSPVATYRLQLTPTFGFDAAAAVVGYLADLGISHLYLSPIFEAVLGSTHGYDQTDPTRLRAELGGDEAFNRLVAAARTSGLRILLDIVPNHMAAHHRNPWWFGLLRHGAESEFNRYFVVDWESNDGRVVLPVLGASLSEVIACGELTLQRDDSGTPYLRYFDKHFPLRDDVPLTPASESAEGLGALLARQHYELACWRDGLQRINYRRFFDIADLAGLRTEDQTVFDATHAKLLFLVAAGSIDGVRVDHIDGLRDPLQYLQRLHTALTAAAPSGLRPLILIEKILASGEQIPAGWPVDGATGYEFLAAAATAMVDPAGLPVLRHHAAQLRAGVHNFHALSISCKEEVAETLLSPELTRLGRSARECLRTCDQPCDDADLRRALIAISTRLGVYRTYADDNGLSAADTARIRHAADAAAASLPPGPSTHACSMIRDLLSLSGPFERGHPRDLALATLRQWQQFTGPLAAKGIEDTALYRDAACVALNDVGTEPVDASPHGGAAGLLTLLAAERVERPFAMNATDTHDAKRSEDVRARLAALSHMPERWNAVLDEGISSLSDIDSDARTPSARDLSLIVHAALAMWPGNDEQALQTLTPRIQAYIVKASREAKLSTSWTNPAADYETACTQAVEALLRGPQCADVRQSLSAMSQISRPLAARLSIASVMLKALFPGTPDWYQGSECRVIALVDPDNRRPVDYGNARDLLAEVQESWHRDPRTAAAEGLADADTDRAKLFVTARVLAVRRALLADQQSMTLASIEISPLKWQWTIAAGKGPCTVRVHLQPATPLDTAATAEGRPAGLNQLTGGPGHEPAWASIVIEGMDTLC